MNYQIKYIKNPVTFDELNILYKSELYDYFITEFRNRTNANLYSTESIRQSIKRLYLILNIPFETVKSELETNKTEFINFCVERYNFYNSYIEENPDGEFAENEELDEKDKSETIEELGFAKSFLLDNFCEFYLLKLGDKELLLHFFKTTRMPNAKKHITEITKIYKSSNNCG